MTTIAVSPGIQTLQAQAAWQAGRYYFVPNVNVTATSATLGTAAMWGIPFYIPNVVTLVRIGSDIAGAGDVGSKLRLGLYSDDGTGRPGNLLLDAGTIAGDSVAVQEITISQAVGAGICWAAAAVQIVTVTQPTVRTQGAGALAGMDAGTATPAAGALSGAVSVAGVAGAFPATFGAPTFRGAAAPRLFVRVA